MSDRAERAPYVGFAGRIGRTFASSDAWWPPRPKPPASAPNVVIMLADDMGFSDLGCFGSEIETPNLDAVAAEGIRYANFHSMPTCSPTRAALLTGLNSHAAGVGFVPHVDPGFPGYAGELPREQPSLAEVFRANGYSTFMVGKWHLCKEGDTSEAGDRHSWPLQRGFDEYYGLLEGMTNLHHPHRLYEGNSVVEVDKYPEGYYLTDDLTDRALRMIKASKAANPSKPFFLYYAHAAVHAPFHVKAADVARHRGRYDIGWDRVREQRLARQIELGIMPPGTELPPRNDEPGEDVAAWDSLSERERILYSRYMELYAAIVQTIDESAGRLRATLGELGELENTLFVFTSDNGASREGRNTGRPNWFHGGVAQTIVPGNYPDEMIEDGLARLEDLGGPNTWPHYPRGWAMACNTPFRLYKVTTHAGGHQVPMILSWPARIGAQPELVRRQYIHVTDVLPTMVDMIGLRPLTEREGRPARELAGSSFAATMADPDAPSPHREQYYESVGHRAYYRDGWAAISFHRAKTPFSQERWSLYNVDDDPTEAVDLADSEPGRLKELLEAWDRAAWDNEVFPLDEGTLLKQALRPPDEAEIIGPVHILPGTPTLDRFRSCALISGRSFRFTAEADLRPGDEGILVAHGSQDSGYVLYVEHDEICFAQNFFGTVRALPPVPVGDGRRAVTVDVQAPGGARWLVGLAVDGEAASAAVELPQLGGLAPYEGIDVGLDRRSPVLWSLYERRGCFPFTGCLRSVTYEPGALAPDAAPKLLEQLKELGPSFD